MTKIIRPLRSGQITIPSGLRKQLGINEQTLLQIRVEEGELRITPVTTTKQAKGSLWMRELYKHFAPVRQTLKESGATEQKIDTAIDRALSAVAKHHDTSSN